MMREHQTLELCSYRLKQADEALSEAMLLQDAGHNRGAINRAYYAMFYATQVLTILNKVKVSEHSGLISLETRNANSSE